VGDLGGATGEWGALMANGRARPGKKGVATRARILDSAAHTLAVKGYAGTRLSDVAAAANTQAGSLYYHFPSREELVEEVLRVGQERTSGFVRRRVAALPADASDLDRLREAISAHLDSGLEMGDYTAATIRTIGQVPEEIRKRRIHEQREYGDFWRSLVNDAHASDELRTDINSSALRMLLLGAMNSVPEWYRPRRDGLSPADLKAQFDLLFLDGLAVHRQAARSIDKNLKVLLTSGYPGAHSADAASDDFPILAKPYRRDELARMLRAALASPRRANSPTPGTCADIPPAVNPPVRYKVAITARVGGLS